MVKLEVTRRKAVMVCMKPTLTAQRYCALVLLLHIFFCHSIHHRRELEATTFEKWTGDNLPWFVAENDIPQKSSIDKECFCTDDIRECEVSGKFS